MLAGHGDLLLPAERWIRRLTCLHYIPVQQYGNYTFRFRILSGNTMFTLLVYDGLQLVLTGMQVRQAALTRGRSEY